MASTNQSPQYQRAEAKFLSAQTDEERLSYLEEMIKECPKHKSAEKMLANLKTRLKKLKYKHEKQSKKAHSTGKIIKKEEMQAAIIGLTNSGKSSLLSVLTNAKPKIASYDFTTKKPILGTLNYQSTHIQIIDLPAIESEYTDQGLINTADTLIIIITDLKQLEKILPFLEKATKTRIIVYNKIDLLNNNEKRKISETLKSKKLNHVLISTKTKENIKELKEKIFYSFGKIRIYTKEPHKPPSKEPMILNKDSTIKDIAEKILHGFSKKIKEIRITGPSSKFPNQVVGLSHIVKDKDIVEFKTK